ncbi:MAG: SDR family oxidoreductase [Pseudolysinimonas sp.]
MARMRALITGATSGFGAGVALELARSRLDVTAAGQTWQQVTMLRQRAVDEKTKLEVIKLDLLDPLDLIHAADRDVDVLILNAGVQETGSLVDIPLDRVRRSFEINVLAHLDLAQRLIPGMMKRKSGKIVWMSSQAGLMGVPFLGAYSATKHAIEAIASTMKAELNPFGIAVATVNPGLYRTGFNDTGAETYGQWSAEQDVHIPMPDAAPLMALQHDPQPMIEAIVAMVRDRKSQYRTMLPEDAVLEAKASQALGWTQKA